MYFWCVLLTTSTKDKTTRKKWINHCKALFFLWGRTSHSFSSPESGAEILISSSESFLSHLCTEMLMTLHCCYHSDPAQQMLRDGHLPHCCLYCSLCDRWDWLLCRVGNKRPTWTTCSDCKGHNVAVTVSSLLSCISPLKGRQ